MIAQYRDLIRYREALRHMVARDLKVRYSHSVLGIVWGLFSPLLMTLVYSIVFSFLRNPIESFPVFILAALLPWQFFSTTVLTTTGAITSNAVLINRVYFPREVLPLANLFSNAVNFVLALAMLFLFMLFFGVPFTLNLLWLPTLIAIQLALMMGLGLFLSTINVFFRDTQQIVDIVMLSWFFLTPIIYELEAIPEHSRLLFQILNPMAGLVVAYRDILYFGRSPNLLVLGVVSAIAALALLIGSLTFRRLSPAFAEEV